MEWDYKHIKIPNYDMIVGCKKQRVWGNLQYKKYYCKECPCSPGNNGNPHCIAEEYIYKNVN